MGQVADLLKVKLRTIITLHQIIGVTQLILHYVCISLSGRVTVFVCMLRDLSQEIQLFAMFCVVFKSLQSHMIPEDEAFSSKHVMNYLSLEMY